MSETTPEQQPSEQTSAPTKQADGEQGNPDTEALGDAGKKALDRMKAERNEAKQQAAELRKQIDEFETFKSALTEALGVKPKGDGSDPLTQVQEQLAQMQRDNSVLALANEHGITDKDDLDLLRSTSDDQARTRLAARLAAKTEETPGTPKPDATQGGKGAVKADPGPGYPRLRAAYEVTNQ